MNSIFNICDYACLQKDGQDWTDAFKKAVSDAAEEGGVIYVPAGVYHTHSIKLESNITLYLSAGAELNFMEDIENYEVIETEFEGVRRKAYMPCIFADKVHHVAIKGEGVINGNGHVWWDAVKGKRLENARPYLICFQNSDHVCIEGVTLLNSPAWTVHPLYCNNVLIQNLTVKNPSDSPNTDGINPDGCSNVRILNCQVDVGDDCITLKSGTEKTPIHKPCENIIVANCNLLHGHGGLVIGSEMSGGVRNVTVSNCVFQDTDRGIRVKTCRHRGGTVENIQLNNLIMDRVKCPFVFNMYYYCGPEGKERYVWDKEAYPVDAGTPLLKDIHISNVTVTDAAVSAGFIYGLKEQPVRNITFSNISITMDKSGKPGIPAMMGQLSPVSAAGFFMRNAVGIVFDNVNIANVEGIQIDIDDSVDLKQ